MKPAKSKVGGSTALRFGGIKTSDDPSYSELRIRDGKGNEDPVWNIENDQAFVLPFNAYLAGSREIVNVIEGVCDGKVSYPGVLVHFVKFNLNQDGTEPHTGLDLEGLVKLVV